MNITVKKLISMLNNVSDDYIDAKIVVPAEEDSQYSGVPDNQKLLEIEADAEDGDYGSGAYSYDDGDATVVEKVVVLFDL